MTTDSTERYVRANGLIIGVLVAVVIILSFLLFKGCGEATDPNGPAYAIDSLRSALRHDSIVFRQQTNLQNEIILERTYEADSLQKQYDSAKKVIAVKGKELLALNTRTKASKTQADTTDYSRHCDTLTHQLDSMGQKIFNAGVTIDSFMLVHQALKEAQTSLILEYDTQLAKERKSNNLINQSYAAQHVYDSLMIKKGKRGRWKDMGKGAAIWEVVRQGIKLFTK